MIRASMLVQLTGNTQYDKCTKSNHKQIFCKLKTNVSAFLLEQPSFNLSPDQTLFWHGLSFQDTWASEIV